MNCEQYWQVFETFLQAVALVLAGGSAGFIACLIWQRRRY